jgi:hypothetical protein
MIETIKLNDAQVQALRSSSDWMPLTDEAADLVRRSGPESGFRSFFIGDELVRMPVDDFSNMLKLAFRTAWHSAMSILDVDDQNMVKDFDMANPQLGDTHFRVTLTLRDGRSATGYGKLVVPGSQTLM